MRVRLGGSRGVFIEFHTGTGEVLLRRLAGMDARSWRGLGRSEGLMRANKIRVLIVDDSAVVRQTLSNLLADDPEIEVMGTASDPFVAADRIAEEIPDVITLDIEMPRMDGLTFLKMIMTQHPVPVVICSSLADQGAQSTLRALDYGAVDIITKPRLGTRAVSRGLAHCDLRRSQGRRRCPARQATHRARHSAETYRRRDPAPGHARHGRDHRER